MRALSRVPELLGAVVVVMFVACAFTPLATVVAKSIGVPRHIAPADAIVVLAGGRVSSYGALSDSSLRRALHGIDLYRDGLAPLLVFSGTDIDPRRAESRIRAALAQRCGVPAPAILTFSGASTTAEEAARTRSLVGPRGTRTVLLVTDADHMIRAAGAFEHVGFIVLPAPVNEVEEDLEPQARLALMHRTLRETAAVLYYRAAGYL
jgi:uncharacterized SAM-binding protein YcdF (DUF218 family)